MNNKNTPQDEKQFYAELLRAFFDSTNDAIFVLCDEMKFITCNKMTQKWLGYTEDELTQHNKRRPITELFGNPNAIKYFASFFDRTLNNEDTIFETMINPENGNQRWIEVSMKRVDIEAGDMIIAVARDITERKKNIATIEYKTNYDQLTNLPNRRYLLNSLLSKSSPLSTSQNGITLLSIDIDRFKEINVSLGQEVGDSVLQKTALRLNKIIDHAENELLVRLEGDEFIIMLPNTDTEKAHDIAAMIKQLISKPLSINSNIIIIDCSIGIANYPQHTSDKSKLIEYVESAMYYAKANNLGIDIYNPEIQKKSSDRLQLITDLRKALYNNQITPYYQPIININKPNEIRVETLARWKHKTQGFISPDIFIQLAEEVGIINDLTSKIINYSITECSDLLNKNIITKLSINISAYCMTNTDIIDELITALAKSKVSAKSIVLEITESAMMSSLEITNTIIKKLYQSGITFAIDDFGTGHSSLAKLKQLPLSELKIDKSFVLDITTNANDAAIAKASIEMAHALDLEVVAEGIENEESWNILKTMGCDYAQGFWMARPMTYKDLVIWLKEDKIFS